MKSPVRLGVSPALWRRSRIRCSSRSCSSCALTVGSSTGYVPGQADRLG